MDELRRREQEHSSTIAAVGTPHCGIAASHSASGTRADCPSVRLFAQLQQRVRELEGDSAAFPCSSCGPVSSPPSLAASSERPALTISPSHCTEEEGGELSQSEFPAGFSRASSFDVSSAESESLHSALSFGDDGSGCEQDALLSGDWCPVDGSKKILPPPLPSHQPVRGSKRRRTGDSRGRDRPRDRAELTAAAASFNWPASPSSFSPSGISSSPYSLSRSLAMDAL